MSRGDKQRWDAAQERVVGKKFCPTCQSMVSPEGGRKVQKFRWVCASCLARRKAAHRDSAA